MAIQQTAEDKRLLQQERDQIAARNATATDDFARMLDPSSPDYVGPGYEDLGRTDAKGNRVLTLTDPQANGAWKMTQAAPAPTNPASSTEDLVADAERMAGTGASPSPAPPRDPFGQRQTPTGTISNPSMTRQPLALDRSAQTPPPVATIAPGGVERAREALKSAGATPGAAPVTGDGNPYTAPGAEAPKVNREAVDAALAPVNQIQGRLVQEALNNASAGVAEAQLARATAEAQSAALGQARAGNRRDRAMLERQAIGEGAFLGQEAGRQAAELRAQEELQNRQFRADTLAKAGELGLNTAAYEVDLAKADLASATNWINNEFEQLGLDKQLGWDKEKLAQTLSQDKMQSILNFTQGMAAIQYQYDQLSVEDQNEADALMMQRYGIDQQTMVALKQIKEQGKFHWDQLLGNMVGGLASGATGALGKKFL